jgi:hypothetical protein
VNKLTINTFVFGNPIDADFEVPFRQSEILIVFNSRFLVDGEGGRGVGGVFGFADSGESGF